MTHLRTALVMSLVLATACGDDGVRHLPDAPSIDDAPIDSPEIDAPSGVALTVTLAGNGSGTITSSPAGITCGATCTTEFALDTVVTLTAVPATGSIFGGWSGACTGTLPTCDVTLAAAATTTATFSLATYTVTVTKAGAGTGTVSGSGITCGSTCMITVEHGTALSLTAAPASLSTFAGWGGACSGTGTCAVTVTANTAINASFALDDVTLFVSRGGTGTGTVTSSPAGISCGSDCMETYAVGAMTTLTAAPATGSTFTGWSGAGCTGTGPCTITMAAAVTVTATFTLNSYALTVARAGNGSGAVTSSPAGIACGTDCTETYAHGTPVTLTPIASTGSTFTGWSGACTGAGACVVTMDTARAATATFTLDTHALAVTVGGTGTGSVTATGITCPGDCNELYNYNTVVNLTATPATGSTFMGWGGVCSGTGACSVTMTTARSVTATFTINTYALTVATMGPGSGAATGTGINCGSDCSETVTHGTVIVLTATPTVGSSFAGWTGACTGGAMTCPVTMDAAKSVTATFTINTYALTVTTSGTGTGSVTGTGITCPGDCSETFTHGTSVTLTANPATGTTFDGWGGACSGTGTCTVDMTAIRNVSATFTLDTFVLDVSRIGNGTGTITGTGINCGTDCSESIGYNMSVTLTATASTANATLSKFVGWGGPCSGTGTCTVTLTSATSVTATFDLAPNIMFVSSARYFGTLGGLSGADSKCQGLASAAGLAGTYVAYLSALNVNTPIHAPSRVGSASGWVRVDGAPVMTFITQFASGSVTNAPRLTELGGDVGATQFPTAWTGTNTGGSFDSQCGSFWNALPGSAMVGVATGTSNAVAAGPATCDTDHRLYCLGIDRAAF